jgi:hypothetical protein
VRCVALGVFWLIGAISCALVLHAEENAQLMAVSEFSFLDTSGEPHEDAQQHEARLGAFNAALRADLAAEGRFRVVRLSCEPHQCTDFKDAAALASEIRRTGARYLLIGGIHKMSTLVGWAKAQVFDLRDDKLVLEKLLSFRGDSDESWRRAEQFLARQIAESELSPAAAPP